MITYILRKHYHMDCMPLWLLSTSHRDSCWKAHLFIQFWLFLLWVCAEALSLYIMCNKTKFYMFLSMSFLLLLQIGACFDIYMHLHSLKVHHLYIIQAMQLDFLFMYANIRTGVEKYLVLCIAGLILLHNALAKLVIFLYFLTCSCDYPNVYCLIMTLSCLFYTRGCITENALQAMK